MGSNVIDRIQKLLRLAKNAGSEHEAALAAKRAAELMAQHEIHEAEISLDTQEPRVAEPIDQRFQLTDTKKKVAWHMRVAYGVARSVGARAYYSKGRVMLFGRLSAVQAASYTTQYLMREIEAITDEKAPSPVHSRAYRNAFRLGCASRIEERLEDQIAAKNMPQHGAAKTKSASASPANDAPPPASAGVIAIIEHDRAEVEAAYEDYSKRWRKTARVGQVSSGSGFTAGQAAGNRVKLGGRARGLKAGQGTLK
jgi:hypothetical protein